MARLDTQRQAVRGHIRKSSRWYIRGYDTLPAAPWGDVATPDVAPPPAAITTVAPATGGVAGGTAVTITGTGFTGATGVTFGGTAGTAFTVVSSTSITVTTPAHASGAVTVVVLSPNGNGTKLTGFTYA